MNVWSGGFVEWTEGNIAYLSVVFSWQLQRAYQRSVWYKSAGYTVIAGGPAVKNNPGWLEGVAVIGDHAPGALERHNPQATFTTRGCVRKCPFCIVSKIEPEYKELNDWPVRPIVCDNNLLAASYAHFDRVIDRLKPLHGVDFNQGLDARLMNNYKAQRLAELDCKVFRLAFDHIKLEGHWLASFQLLRSAGIPARKIQSYVLIGYDDTPEDALYRLELVKSVGGWPNPMRYQPLDAIKRNCYIAPGWTERELRRYMRYWSRQIWLEHLPFAEYVG